jgi:hypothetical protein
VYKSNYGGGVHSPAILEIPEAFCVAKDDKALLVARLPEQRGGVISGYFFSVGLGFSFSFSGAAV